MALGEARYRVRKFGFHAGGRDFRGEDDEGGMTDGLLDRCRGLGPVGDVEARRNIRKGVRE